MPPAALNRLWVDVFAWSLQVVVRESERRSHAAMREWEHASLTDLVLLPLLPYLVWAFIYYGKARAEQALPARLCACSKDMLLPAASPEVAQLLARSCTCR